LFEIVEFVIVIVERFATADSEPPELFESTVVRSMVIDPLKFAIAFPARQFGWELFPVNVELVMIMVPGSPFPTPFQTAALHATCPERVESWMEVVPLL
jgi:hypothetical protein